MSKPDINPRWITQGEACQALGIHRRDFLKLEVMPVFEYRTAKYYRLIDLCEAYHRHESARQGQNATPGQETIDFEYERSKNTRLQADRVGQKNAIARRDWWPINSLEQAFSASASGIVAVLESLPLNIKRHHPEVSLTLLAAIEATIIKHRNVMAKQELDWPEDE